MRHELSLPEIKKICFEGLLQLKTVCSELNLTYYLAYGTLLGAVRHEGFIPWDDDVDVFIPRNDYNKLIKNSQKLELGDWELLSFRSCDRYCLPWAKLVHKKTKTVPSRFCTGLIYGCSIDIFPLDTVNASDLDEAAEIVDAICNEYLLYKKKYKPIGVLTMGGWSAIKRAVKSLHYRACNAFYGNWNSRLDSIEMKINEKGDKGKYYAFMYDEAKTVIWEKADFVDKEQTLLEFEKEMFSVPKDYDTVLTKYYGDYMTPPKVEEQVTNHKYRVFSIK